MKNQHSMQDPTTQYEKPSIPEQGQAEPGLDKKMMPEADHGEKTYQGAHRLEGRKALITGGDSGIGRAVAIGFAREGADVAIAYLPSEEADAREVAKHITDAGRRAVLLPGDLRYEEACEHMVDQAAEQLGGLDILVNNAGKQVYVDNISDLDLEQVKETFAVNIVAMFATVKQALRYLPRGATIINTTSIQAYAPSPGLLDYAATKAAIANFTKGLAQQLASKGIRVNAVAPGPIWTPLQPSHGQPAEKLKQFGMGTPLGRPGQPAELAPTYVFLASQESSYITGEIIGVTGGNPIS